MESRMGKIDKEFWQVDKNPTYICWKTHKGRHTIDTCFNEDDMTNRLGKIPKEKIVKVTTSAYEAASFLDKEYTPPLRPLTAEDRWRNWSLGRPLNYRS